MTFVVGLAGMVSVLMAIISFVISGPMLSLVFALFALVFYILGEVLTARGTE